MARQELTLKVGDRVEFKVDIETRGEVVKVTQKEFMFGPPRNEFLVKVARHIYAKWSHEYQSDVLSIDSRSIYVVNGEWV